MRTSILQWIRLAIVLTCSIHYSLLCTINKTCMGNNRALMKHNLRRRWQRLSWMSLILSAFKHPQKIVNDVQSNFEWVGSSAEFFKFEFNWWKSTIYYKLYIWILKDLNIISSSPPETSVTHASPVLKYNRYHRYIREMDRRAVRLNFQLELWFVVWHVQENSIDTSRWCTYQICPHKWWSGGNIVWCKLVGYINRPEASTTETVTYPV